MADKDKKEGEGGEEEKKDDKKGKGKDEEEEPGCCESCWNGYCACVVWTCKVSFS